MTAEFERLAQQYRDAFGELPPVHNLGQWPTPAQALDMVRHALERGTPITAADYPKLNAGEVC